VKLKHTGKDGEMKKTEKNGDKMVGNHMPDTISEFVWAMFRGPMVRVDTS